MRHATVVELAKMRGNPAVSILCPLDPRRPGNAHDAAVLAELRDHVRERVRAVVPERAAADVLAAVDDALAEIDLQHPTAGVGVFVAPEVSCVVPLESPVEPEVAVGTRFVIRALLTALEKEQRARVVVLSRSTTRCIDVTGGKARERRDLGFPIEVRAPVEADTPHHDFPLDEHEHDEAAKFVFRAVDEALRRLQRQDARPLVLFGTERDLAYFDEVTQLPSDVVGRLHGNYEQSTPAAIAALAAPVVDAHRCEHERQVCHDVREAIGARAVAGIVNTWEAAHAGRGHRLVVEEGFRCHARVRGETFVPARRDEPDAFDAVEDVVEEVVRHGGDVVVVGPDRLVDLGRIALFNRYATPARRS